MTPCARLLLRTLSTRLSAELAAQAPSSRQPHVAFCWPANAGPTAVRGLQVRFRDIAISASVYAGSRALPTLVNSFRNLAEDALIAARLMRSSKKPLTILHGVTGVLKPVWPQARVWGLRVGVYVRACCSAGPGRGSLPHSSSLTPGCPELLRSHGQISPTDGSCRCVPPG